GFSSSTLANALRRAEEQLGSSRTLLAGFAIKLAMYMAGAAVPLALWLIYFYLAYWGIEAGEPNHQQTWLKALSQATPYLGGNVATFYVGASVLLLAIGACFRANANSLHRIYRDRLSKAFLFDPNRRLTESIWRCPAEMTGAETDAALRNSDLLPLKDK